MTEYLEIDLFEGLFQEDNINSGYIHYIQPHLPISLDFPSGSPRFGYVAVEESSLKSSNNDNNHVHPLRITTESHDSNKLNRENKSIRSWKSWTL